MVDGKFAGEEFNEFLKQVIAAKWLDSKQEGITKLVLDKGFKTLSQKQKHVFRRAIMEYVYDDCQRDGLEIPWGEMFNANHNGGLCSWCEHQQEAA